MSYPRDQISSLSTGIRVLDVTKKEKEKKGNALAEKLKQIKRIHHDSSQGWGDRVGKDEL